MARSTVLEWAAVPILLFLVLFFSEMLLFISLLVAGANQPLLKADMQPDNLGIKKKMFSIYPLIIPRHCFPEEIIFNIFI